MVQFNFIFDIGVSIEQRVGFEMAAAIWSHYLTDNIEVNLHLSSTNSLGPNGQAVGGAVPLFHEIQYGAFREYYENDITSDYDTQAHGSLSDGNTVDLMINGELVDNNTNMLVTSAQAKAIGMVQALDLGNGSTWERDIVDPNALDGYVIINQSFNWNYDFAREKKAPQQSLDFLSMAMHEIGHQLGFVSGIDGTMEVLELHSGETRIDDFTELDLFRHTIDSGSVSDVTLGANSYFSIDGGKTNLADFSIGQLLQSIVETFQASHWKRFQNAIGVMDPTLAYGERLTITELDLQALDVLGYNVDTTKIGQELDYNAFLQQAENKVSLDLGIDLAQSSDPSDSNDIYKLGYSGWWKLFEKQIHELGYSGWWDIFEQGKQYWEQELAGTLELGYSGWWQKFDEKMQELESQMLTLGYSGWWQEFQSDMLALGYSGWWDVFELGYSGWWQKLDNYFSKLEKTNGEDTSVVDQVINSNTSGGTTSGGNQDLIVAGFGEKDLINGLEGDDLIDGKSGDDVIIGGKGDDMIFGLDGNDTIYGGVGDDFISGETDHDQLYGEEGADILSGGAGNDYISGGSGKDVLKGDQGQDVLIGGTEDDVLEGGDDNDELYGEQGKDLLDGGAGDDILRGDSSSNSDNSASTSEINYWFRIEAESMKLSNSSQKADAIASGGGIIITGGKGKTQGIFTGVTGVYDIVVAYYDSSNGQGEIKLEIGEQNIDQWTLNQDSNSMVTRTIQGVTLTNGEKIKLESEANGNEFIKIDYLDFISVNDTSTYDYNQLNSDVQLNLVKANKQVDSNGFRLEAEAMTLANGYQVETSNNFFSGDAVIKTTVAGQQATASYTFTGNSGIYNLFVSYFDDISGKATAKIQVNGTTLNSWTFNQNSNLTEYRLVGLEVSFNEGDLITVTGVADGSDQAKIDYFDFVPVLNQQLDANSDYTMDYFNPGTGVAGRVEVENMTLSGNYNVASISSASGGKAVESLSSTTGMTATTIFTGATGIYNVILGYYDENDGLAQFNVTLNKLQQLDSWQANLNLGSSSANSQTFVTRTIAQQILLNSGDEVQIKAIKESSDRAYVDYIEFIEYDPNAPIRVETESMTISGSYTLEQYSFASNGKVLRSNSTNPANALKVNTAFTGESGIYSVVVRYFDENDGQAQFSASLRGVQLDSWVGNKNLGSSSVSQQTSVIRTVASNIEINTGDIFQLTSIRDSGDDSGDYGRIDYVEFIAYDPNATANTTAESIQLEIEDMQLSGAGVINANFAHGGGYVTTSSGDDDDDEGGSSSLTASTLFTGEEGYYDIEIAYYDTNNGEAGVTVKLNEDVLSNWVLNQNLGTSQVGIQSFTTRNVAQGVYLETNDVISIIGNKDSSDKVNLDYIKLTPVAPPAPVIEAPAISDSDNGDILRGGAGNDQLFGDEGNDILYGEDEYNTINGGNDTVVGGAGDDVLYGNSGDDVLYGDEMDDSTPVVKTPATLTFQQGVNGYSGTVDTMIQQNSSTNYGSNTALNVDSDVNNGNPAQVLLRFNDIFGSLAGQIALDDTIDSAVLELQVFDPGSAIELYNMLQSWADSVTWTSFTNGIQADGIEASTTASASTPAGQEIPIGTLTIDVTSSLQVWQADPTSNHGWVFLPTSNNGLDFYSAQGTSKPRLVVNVNQDSTTNIVSITANGNDILAGNSGNDSLFGGVGDDILNGTDKVSLGKGEQDTLTGGEGADTFVLGDVNNRYYLGNGDLDFATVTDFAPLVDSVQVHGSATNYQQTQQVDNRLLSYQGDLIAVFEGVNSDITLNPVV
jgi:Ca2+-binding RTX toxin-like protein